MIFVLLFGCPGPGPGVDGDQCVSCHVGIEPIHDILGTAQCVLCHGGDPDATAIETAHVPVPTNYWEVRGDALPPASEGFIKDFTPDQLDALEPAYVRFINPGDIRVVDDTCGQCHKSQAATVKNSIMTTNAGHYMPTRHLAGLQEQTPLYGAHAAEDPECDSTAYTACSLQTLPPPSEARVSEALASDEVQDLEQISYDHYLAKSCDHCHAAGYGLNNSPHLYRSSGCTSCHMLYNQDGVYKGGDQALPNNVPVYSETHRITKAIPTEQCTTCHFQGGRIGLTFRGIRESGFSEVPEHAEPWAESAYGHTAGYYLLDEDTRNDVDETPPDLHYAAGMHCADCHVGSDVHGDGKLHMTSKLQIDLRCEDCHGSVRQGIVPDASGLYRTEKGRVLPQLSTGAQGEVVLTGVVDGAEHVVPQAIDAIATNPDAHAAMAPNESGWSHTDSLTCDTCHTSYNQFCLGCHVTVDLRLQQIDRQTGTATPGLVRGSRSTYSLDNVLLGQASDGRAQSVHPSQQVQLTLVDDEGEVRLGTQAHGRFRTSSQGNPNLGFAPFFQHTTTDKPRDCSVCHRSDATEAELKRVRGVYGFGTGEFLLEAADGTTVDALKFLSDEGAQLTDWVHPGTGPLAPEVRERALGVVLDEQP